LANDRRARLILDDLMNNSGLYDRLNNRMTGVRLDKNDTRNNVKGLETKVPTELKTFYENVNHAEGSASRNDPLLELVQKLATPRTAEERFGVALVKFLFDVTGPVGAGVSTASKSSWVKANSVLTKTSSPSVGEQVGNENGNDDPNSGTIPDTKFDYALDRYRMRAIMDDLSATAAKKQGSAAAFFGGVTEGYRRDSNNNLVDSKGVEVGHGSANAEGLTEASLCYTTKFVGNGVGSATATKTCGQYFDGCLRGTGIKACKDYLTDSGYWGDLAVDIKNMSPVMAVQTLEKFGYRTYKNSSGVVEFETVDDWLKRLTDDDMLGSTTGGTSDADSITKNDKLVGYMAAVVAKVNGNPAILNKDLTNTVNTPNQRLNAYGIKGKTFVPTSTTALLHRLSNAVAVDAMRNSILFGLSSVGTVFLQTGGDIVKDIEAAEDAKEMWHSTMFRSIFTRIQTALSSAGKKIQEDDKNEIEKLIVQLEDSERKLFTTMKFASKYVRLLELFGDEDSQKVLNLTDLKKFVNARNKYQLKTTKRTNGLVQILLKLSEASDGSDRTRVPVPAV
jgi:hypothetical protein